MANKIKDLRAMSIDELEKKLLELKKEQLNLRILRDFEEHTLLVAVNFSNNTSTMKLSIPQHAFDWMQIPQTDTLNKGTVINVTVPPMDGVILQLI